MVHLMRRVLIVFIIGVYFVDNTISIQLAVWSFLNLFYAMFILGFEPYTTRYFNRMDGFNESSVVVINCFLFCFTPWLDDTDSRYLVGWMVAGVFVGTALVNFMSLLSMNW